MAQQGNVIHRETQYSRQPWLLAVILISVLISLVAFMAAFQQSEMSIWFLGLYSAGALLLLVFFWFSHLEIEVRTDGLFFRYLPFHLSFRKIPLEGVTKVEAVTYSPLRDYGGWGLRLGRGGRVYNPMGNRGVRIDYTDGSHILLGSNTPERLAEAIREIMRY